MKTPQASARAENVAVSRRVAIGHVILILYPHSHPPNTPDTREGCVRAQRRRCAREGCVRAQRRRCGA
ncbi:hypothetical protein T492DRAFT_164776 [Pavlovales sp. CCMP2436]|nr:hypothetical protein T492DRAFT_164776 [Pavlovales sp. CCMP2436]